MTSYFPNETVGVFVMLLFIFICLLPFIMLLLTYYRIKDMKENMELLVKFQREQLALIETFYQDKVAEIEDEKGPVDAHGNPIDSRL